MFGLTPLHQLLVIQQSLSHRYRAAERSTPAYEGLYSVRKKGKTVHGLGFLQLCLCK